MFIKNLFNAVIISLAFISCQSNSGEKPISTAKLKEYKIELSAKNEGDRKVKINISTDFPDGVSLLISIGRTHFLKGDKETYSGEIFSKDFMVKNGKIETVVNINDTDWYNEHQNLVKELPDNIAPISKISDEIDINVLFSPNRDQSTGILKILGTKGEFITGDGVEDTGKVKYYRVSKELKIPFKK